MKRILTGILLATLAACGTVFVSAQTFGDKTGLDSIFSDGKGFRGQFVKAMMNRASDRLKLTEEQRSEIRAILVEAAPRITVLLTETKAVHEQIKPLGRDGVYNPTAVQRLSTQQANNARLLIVEKEKIKAAVFAVLNETQRSTAGEIQDQIEAQLRQLVSSRIGMKF